MSQAVIRRVARLQSVTMAAAALTAIPTAVEVNSRGRARTMRTTTRPRRRRGLIEASAWPSRHEGVEIRRGDGAIEVRERALVLHLAGGVEQPRRRRAVERGREADTPDAGSFQ